MTAQGDAWCLRPFLPMECFRCMGARRPWYREEELHMFVLSTLSKKFDRG